MSIISSIMNTLVEDDKTAPIPAPPAVPTATVMGPLAFQPTAISSVLSPVETSGLMEKVQPKDGPLVQFLATLHSLSEYIPDEASRFRATIKALETQGLTVEHVNGQIVFTSTRIDEEITAFESARQRKTDQDVSFREQCIAQLAAEIDGHNVEIKKHEDKIAECKQHRDELAVALTTAKASIANRTDQFQNEVKSVRNTYEDLARKLNLYSRGNS